MTTLVDLIWSYLAEAVYSRSTYQIVNNTNTVNSMNKETDILTATLNIAEDKRETKTDFKSTGKHYEITIFIYKWQRNIKAQCNHKTTYEQINYSPFLSSGRLLFM